MLEAGLHGIRHRALALSAHLRAHRMRLQDYAVLSAMGSALEALERGCLGATRPCSGHGTQCV